MSSEKSSTPLVAAGDRAAARVLLVEDEPSLVLTLSDRLISEGFWSSRRRLS